MTVRAPRALALALAAILGAGLSAQQRPPVFRSTTDYVVLDVVVTDADDRPVTGLTAADFEIRQGRRVQTIAEFTYVSVPMGGRSIDLVAPAGAPSDVFTNAHPAPDARAFLFVLHRLDSGDLTRIKRIMTEFLGALAPSDRVAIVFPERSDLSQDFTLDSTRLVQAVNNLKGALGFDFGTGRTGINYIVYFRNLLRSLAGARENRRALVYVGNAWPCRPEAPECATLLRDFARANIPIYTLDPRGLMAPELGLAAALEQQTPENRRGLDRAIQAQKDSLREAAHNTNGRAYVNNWDVVRAARELVADNGNYYLLGFYPSPYEADGRFHAVDVAVRRPGARVRARSGYTSKTPAPVLEASTRAWHSLQDGLPSGDLSLHAFAAPLAGGETGANAVLTLDVAYPASNDGRRREDDDLQIAWIAIDPDARVRASNRRSIQLPLEGRPPEAFTLSIHDLIGLPAGRSTLRVGVTSRVLGRDGTVHLPVNVRHFSPQDFDVTPLVLGREGGPQIRVVRIAPGLAGLPFHPTTARTFTAGDRLHVFARAFAAPAAVTAELLLKRGEIVVTSIPVSRAPAAAAEGATDIRASVETSTLSAGSYELVLTLTAPDRPSVTRAIGLELSRSGDPARNGGR